MKKIFYLFMVWIMTLPLASCDRLVERGMKKQMSQNQSGAEMLKDGSLHVVLVGSGGYQSQSYSALVPEIRNPPDRGAAVWVFEVPSSR